MTVVIYIKIYDIKEEIDPQIHLQRFRYILPPLVAHVLVALTTDHHTATEAGHKLIDIYTRYPFYVKMTWAGFPTTVGGAAPDDLVDSLVISGNEDTVSGRFSEFLASELDELMVTLLPIINVNDEQVRFLQLVAGL